MAVTVEMVSDFVCPWCYVGHQHLDAGIAAAGLAEPPTIRYLPYELNPDMPVGGVDRNEYYIAKFGEARWKAAEARLLEVGAASGAVFRFDRLQRTPNTRLAHRLMVFAQAQGDATKAHALAGSIFSSYFSEGRDIGAAAVLVELAAAVGYDPTAAADFLASEGERDVVAAELQAHASGVQGVPTFRIGGTAVVGAQPPEMLAGALQAAARGR